MSENKPVQWQLDQELIQRRKFDVIEYSQQAVLEYAHDAIREMANTRGLFYSPRGELLMNGHGVFRNATIFDHALGRTPLLDQGKYYVPFIDRGFTPKRSPGSEVCQPMYRVWYEQAQDVERLFIVRRLPSEFAFFIAGEFKDGKLVKFEKSAMSEATSEFDLECLVGRSAKDVVSYFTRWV